MKIKYLILVTQLQNLLEQLLKIKYLMLVVWLKKIDFNTKVSEIEGQIPDVSNLVKNTDFDTRLKKTLVIGLLKIKVNTCWLKMN